MEIDRFHPKFAGVIAPDALVLDDIKASHLTTSCNVGGIFTLPGIAVQFAGNGHRAFHKIGISEREIMDEPYQKSQQNGNTHCKVIPSCKSGAELSGHP